MSVSSEAVTQSELDSLCSYISIGKSVREYISVNSPDYSRGTFYEWLASHATQAQQDQYARALAASAESDVDDVRYIADTEKDPALARVKIDACKWVAGKKLPKKYGEKSSVELTGKDGKDLNPPQVITAEAVKAIREKIQDEY